MRELGTTTAVAQVMALAGPAPVWIALGAALCVIGAGMLFLLRSGSGRRSLDMADNPPDARDLALVSPMTRAVVGLSLLATGYHLIMHAIGKTALVAPLVWVVSVAAGMCALSLVTDVIEARGLRAAADEAANNAPFDVEDDG